MNKLYVQPMNTNKKDYIYEEKTLFKNILSKIDYIITNKVMKK